jgi:hypothetical protein
VGAGVCTARAVAETLHGRHRSPLDERRTEGDLCMLADTKAYSGIAVHDMNAAREFYAGRLGLRTSE